MEKENGKLTLVAASYLKKLFPEAKGAPKAMLMPAFNKLLWFFLCGVPLNDSDIHCHRRTSDKDLYFISWHNCALLLAVKKVDLMNDLLEEPIFLASHVSFVDFATGGKVTQESIRRSEESFLEEFIVYLEKQTWKEILEMGNVCLLDCKDPKKIPTEIREFYGIRDIHIGPAQRPIFLNYIFCKKLNLYKSCDSKNYID